MSNEVAISSGQHPSRRRTSNSSVSAPNLSAVIISLNEEANLRQCLRSLPSGCEIIVVDSGSRDGTLDICKEFGATVYVRPFDNHSNQKNFAIQKATRPWVFSIDADEEVQADLCQQFAILTSAQPGNECYRVVRRLFFLGRLLRFGKTKDKPLRLFPRDKAKFTGLIHEELQADQGLVERTINDGFLIHRSYRDLNDYFVKFNSYTSLVAKRHVQEGHLYPNVAMTMVRPFFEFISRYFFRLGVFDGYPGFVYALISSTYAFIKYAKLIEMTKTTAGVR